MRYLLACVLIFALAAQAGDKGQPVELTGQYGDTYRFSDPQAALAFCGKAAARMLREDGLTSSQAPKARDLMTACMSLAKKYGGRSVVRSDISDRLAAEQANVPAYSDCLPWLIRESERTKARSAETSEMAMGWKNAEVTDLRRQLKEAIEKNEQLSRRYEQVARDNATMNAAREINRSGSYGYASSQPTPYYVPYYPATDYPAPASRPSLHCTTQNFGGIIVTNCN